MYGRPIPILEGLLALAALLAPAAAQNPTQEPAVPQAPAKAPPAYPERDWQSPFRSPSEIYAPPDKLYKLLRQMRALADNPANQRHVDELGREVIESEAWRELRNEAQRVGIDASYLSAIIRESKNDDDRRTAFYAMFHSDRVDYVFNLIAHIPGEPLRVLRQEALPRAVDYLRVHLGKRFGDLSDEQKQAILAQMPQPGSPAARAQGIARAPRDEDHLNVLRLTPFFQLLDVDTAIDQAQALWFLEQVFGIREDLAVQWLEPALPRVKELLIGDDPTVRRRAAALLRVIGPGDLPVVDLDADDDALLAWARQATMALFPPIRNVNDALILLFPSPERDAIVRVGTEALKTSSIGDPFRGQHEGGQHYAGFRVAKVPDELLPLAIPKGAVITTVNGVAVFDGKTLLQAVSHLLEQLEPRTLLVEYVLDGKPRAVEYRVR